MDGHSQCSDNTVGNQSMHSDRSGSSDSGQSDIRTNFLGTKAVATKRNHCTDCHTVCSGNHKEHRSKHGHVRQLSNVSQASEPDHNSDVTDMTHSRTDITVASSSSCQLSCLEEEDYNSRQGLVTCEPASPRPSLNPNHDKGAQAWGQASASHHQHTRVAPRSPGRLSHHQHARAVPRSPGKQRRQGLSTKLSQQTQQEEEEEGLSEGRESRDRKQGRLTGHLSRHSKKKQHANEAATADVDEHARSKRDRADSKQQQQQHVRQGVAVHSSRHAAGARSLPDRIDGTSKSKHVSLQQHDHQHQQQQQQHQHQQQKPSRAHGLHRHHDRHHVSLDEADAPQSRRHSAKAKSGHTGGAVLHNTAQAQPQSEVQVPPQQLYSAQSPASVQFSTPVVTDYTLRQVNQPVQQPATVLQPPIAEANDWTESWASQGGPQAPSAATASAVLDQRGAQQLSQGQPAAARAGLGPAAPDTAYQSAAAASGLLGTVPAQGILTLPLRAGQGLSSAGAGLQGTALAPEAGPQETALGPMQALMLALENLTSMSQQKLAAMGEEEGLNCAAAAADRPTAPVSGLHYPDHAVLIDHMQQSHTCVFLSSPDTMRLQRQMSAVA